MRFSRRAVFGVMALSAIALASSGQAADTVKFTNQGFSEAQKAGKSVLVDISASWCPTCKVQAPIISKLTSEPKYRDVIVMTVDFDSQKDVVKALGARSQSTLIGFKGAKEVGRSAGDTNPLTIEDLIENTL